LEKRVAAVSIDAGWSGYLATVGYLVIVGCLATVGYLVIVGYLVTEGYLTTAGCQVAGISSASVAAGCLATLLK